ncbi:MAG TPA: phosphoheptose isomerase, partial [Acidobacteriota bacterium]|nr:phosphoheptose isomerase [Acidobacteriota bacterium]
APPDVGGRYAALSVFGLVPAALIGMDLRALLDRARSMGEASSFCVSSSKSPGLQLGAALGELASGGRDKLTLVMSPSLEPFSAWLEQLVAESTGKDGTGIIPIAGESLGPLDSYDSDRFFVATLLRGDDLDGVDKKLSELEESGHPVVRIRLDDKFDLGREIFRWELAVPAAAAVLNVHPFDQPDVELAKKLAQEAMRAASRRSSQDSAETVGIEDSELESLLQSWLESKNDGDFLSLQAYLAPSPENSAALEALRDALRKRLRCATTLGFGPRFLHSTGQLHKGGADNGLFLQLVDDPSRDLAVPETDYTFGQLIQAQAQGDLQALRQRGRRVLRVQLGKDPGEGLRRLSKATA